MHENNSVNKMESNLMICENSAKGLKLNESDIPQKKYILEGVFAELDKLNRNQRIYPKDEYLRHLQYLRDDIKKGEPLLGELDHPEDRFEVKLKEASHRVIDLWYDPRANCVMGRIELLNTPNGKLAQSLVDQGIPLHISSRAAGTVNADNKVSIQQIYTYDLVCKPGFAGAVLHTVNESVGGKYSPDAIKFLNDAVKSESKNAGPQYGIMNENFSISEVRANVNLRKEAKELQINKKTEINEEDMSKSLMEADDFNSSAIAKADSTVGKPLGMTSEGDEAEDKDDKSDKPAEGDTSSDKGEGKDGEGVEIVDVKPEFDDEQEGGEGEGSDNAEGDGGEDGKDDKDDKGDGADVKDVKPEEGKADESSDGDTSGNTPKPTEVNKLNSDAQDKLKGKNEILDKLDDLIKAAKDGSKNKKADECGESCHKNETILSQYPVTRMLTEENFARFTGLTEQQKSKVVAYLQDNKMFAPDTINENWKNGIDYVTPEPAWLKFAPAEYKAVYESADAQVKENLHNMAAYLLFENQHDVNLFWENSGIMQANERKLLNESFVSKMPKIAAKEEPKGLGYTSALIDQVADMACEYDKR